MTKELLLIPAPTIRPSQSNYNAINHHTEQKNLSVTQEYINMWGKYHSSQLGKEFMGSVGVYLPPYVQGQDQGQIATQAE